MESNHQNNSPVHNSLNIPAHNSVNDVDTNRFFVSVIIHLVGEMEKDLAVHVKQEGNGVAIYVNVGRKKREMLFLAVAMVVKNFYRIIGRLYRGKISFLSSSRQIIKEMARLVA